MAVVKFHKVTSLPGVLEADALYFVSNSNYTETYVTDNSGNAKSVGNSSMINELINVKLQDWNIVEVVASITARNALTLNRNTLVLVVDATGDSTVAAGSAMYVYRESNTSWEKVYEFENLDVTLNWSSIVGRPTSSVAQIDAAVTNTHTHTNKAYLDKISESGGQLLYNGSGVSTNWTTQNW